MPVPAHFAVKVCGDEPPSIIRPRPYFKVSRSDGPTVIGEGPPPKPQYINFSEVPPQSAEYGDHLQGGIWMIEQPLLVDGLHRAASSPTAGFLCLQTSGPTTVCRCHRKRQHGKLWPYAEINSKAKGVVLSMLANHPGVWVLPVVKRSHSSVGGGESCWKTWRASKFSKMIPTVLNPPQCVMADVLFLASPWRICTFSSRRSLSARTTLRLQKARKSNVACPSMVWPVALVMLAFFHNLRRCRCHTCRRSPSAYSRSRRIAGLSDALLEILECQFKRTYKTETLGSETLCRETVSEPLGLRSRYIRCRQTPEPWPRRIRAWFGSAYGLKRGVPALPESLGPCGQSRQMLKRFRPSTPLCE